tara:strand:+ start:630 stop:1013 length:384 start_codon:yes stop_codon:yes gene_type:complete
MSKNTQNTKANGTDGTLSDKKEKMLKQLREQMGNVTEACKNCNIGRRTFYNWKHSDKKFKEECDNIPEELLDLAEHQLMKQIKDSTLRGHITSLIYFLNNKGKKRGYNDNTENEQTKPFDRIELEGI